PGNLNPQTHQSSAPSHQGIPSEKITSTSNAGTTEASTTVASELTTPSELAPRPASEPVAAARPQPPPFEIGAYVYAVASGDRFDFSYSLMDLARMGSSRIIVLGSVEYNPVFWATLKNWGMTGVVHYNILNSH